jgi:hypothetical protein
MDKETKRYIERENTKRQIARDENDEQKKERK